MKKIGILTYHKAINYGADLQAVALRKVLELLGADAFFYDYYPDYHKRLYANPSITKRNVFVSPNKNYQNIFLTFSIIKRRKAFERFQSEYVVPFCRKLTECSDIALYGSDQIWRKQPYIEAYNPMYFGKNDIETNLHASYAASIDRLPDVSETGEFLDLLRHYNKISVRETTLHEFLKEHGVDSNVVLDPTLLLSKEQWIDLLNLKERNSGRYTLYFSLNKDFFNINNIKQFSKKREKALRMVYGKPLLIEKKNCRYSLNPKELLQAYLDADFIFTSSFHGTVFAIIMNKQFFVSTNVATDRITSLLDSLGLSERFIDGSLNIPNIADIDYSRINRLLETKRTSSYEFLQSLL